MSISRLRLHLQIKETSLLHVSILSRFEIVEIICPDTWEIIPSVSFTCWTTDNFQALLKAIFSWICFLPFACKHKSRTVRNPFYIHCKNMCFYLSDQLSCSWCVHIEMCFQSIILSNQGIYNNLQNSIIYTIFFNQKNMLFWQKPFSILNFYKDL